MDWSLKRTNRDLFIYVRDLIALRKAHPIFRLRTRKEVEQRLQFLDTPDSGAIALMLDGDGLPGESWKKVCVLLNSDNTQEASIDLPPGRWTIALDERGVGPNHAGSAKISVTPKSGMILYQR